MAQKQAWFHGKKALIVGGSEGIGYALAQELVGQGAQVMIASRNRSKLERAQKSLPGSLIWTLDVAEVESVAREMKGLISEFGVPEILINSAGLAHPAYIEVSTNEEVEQMFQVNALGTIHVCRSVVPEMIRQGRGQVLNVSSVAGYVGLFGYTSYCASKSAVIGFSEALREEVEPLGLQVSVLCPPNTKTPGLEKENEKKPKEVLAMEEKVKVLEPTEVAQYALKKIARGKFWIIPTLDSQMAFYLKRWWPGLLRKFTRRTNIS